MKRSILTIIGVTLVAAMAILGCSSSTPPVAPLAAFSPEIINTPDNFQFQATGTQNVSATVSYNWSNSGTQATINHSSTVDSGTTLLRIYDANNTMVYSSGLSASLNEPTTAGVAGMWRVSVVLTNVYGTLNFRAQML